MYSIPNTVVPNASIFHNGITKNSLTNVMEAFDRMQIGMAEVSTTKTGFLQNSAPENSMAEISTIKNTLVHFNPAQVSPVLVNTEVYR